MENQENNIVKSIVKGKLVVARVFKSDYQKEGTLTAELKQTVTITSKYPSKSVSNDLQQNIFSADDFGFETKDFVQERTDVAWLDVPAGSTVESVSQKLTQFPGACIYRIMSNRPILHSGQLARLNQETQENANFLFNAIANRQVLRYSDQDETRAGKLIFDKNGKPQYKGTYFSSVAKEDVDMRDDNPDNNYYTQEMLVETNNGVHVVENQTV